MNSGRFWLLVVSLAGTAVVLSPGCGDNTGTPCGNCPPMEGSYELEFAAGTLPADCAAIGVRFPQGQLEIERTGPNLNATVDGVGLTGTLYQSYDFNLQSPLSAFDGGTDTLSFSGRYIPVVRDGGVGQLTGSFTGTYTRTAPQGTRRCTLSRSYTATQE
jgi:hypothetical protein